MLDEAKAPATLVSEYGSGTYRGFVRGVSHVAVAPDGEAVAYTVDPTGDEVYTCEFLPARPAVERVDAIVAWGATSEELYALRTDATGRPHEVWRSRGGAEELVYREDDERFRLEFGGGDAGLVLARSRDAAEVLRVADKEKRASECKEIYTGPGSVLHNTDYWAENAELTNIAAEDIGETISEAELESIGLSGINKGTGTKKDAQGYLV